VRQPRSQQSWQAKSSRPDHFYFNILNHKSLADLRY
jgi:hypothetical protein